MGSMLRILAILTTCVSIPSFYQPSKDVSPERADPDGSDEDLSPGQRFVTDIYTTVLNTVTTTITRTTMGSSTQSLSFDSAGCFPRTLVASLGLAMC